MASHESEDTQPTQVLGFELEDAASDASASIAVPGVWGKLVALGDQATIVLKGDGLFKVGRSKSASFTIANPVISNTHLAFAAEPGSRWTVTDTSTNGTLLSRAGVAQRLIKGEPTPLVPGDTLRLGNLNAPIEVDEHLAYIFHPVIANPGVSPHRGKRKAEADSPDMDQEPGPGEPQAQRQKLETRPSAAGSSASDSTAVGGEGATDMEQTLECSICREVYHDPVGLIPCLHCICAGCWVALTASDSAGAGSCPECRAAVQGPKRNIVVAQLAEAFLKEHPEKRRPKDDTDRLDQLSAKLLDGLKKDEATAGAAVVAAGDNDDYSDSDGYDGYDDDGDGTPVRTCRECLTARQGDGHLCPDDGSAVHAGCSCCGQFMPVRAGLVDTPTQCKGCLRSFCCVYFGGAAGCLGCANTTQPGTGPALGGLVQLKDVAFVASTLQMDCMLGHHSIHHCILNSRAERRILADHAAGQAMDPTLLFKDCVAQSRAGTLDVPIPGDAADCDGICRLCASDFFCRAAYKWREAIPDADLPIAVTARGSCWYGKGCRTQYNPSNPGHGERLNHICDATNDR